MSRYKEIAKIIQENNPNIQLYTTKDLTAIGYWSHNLNRVQVLVSELLNGSWAAMPDILINGEPCFKADDWRPVTFEEVYR